MMAPGGVVGLNGVGNIQIQQMFNPLIANM
jgi:hypothetical protein